MKKQPQVINQFIGEYFITVVVGESITVKNGDFTNTFRIGDMAEYNSYNLSYYGPIISIGPKTVTIRERHNHTPATTHRLSFQKFAWRNIRFNVDKAAEENFETMQYL